MNSSRGVVYLWLVSFAVWLLLTASLQPSELVLGVGVATVVALAARGIAPFFGRLRSPLTVLLGMPAYAVTFLGRLIVANLDVARRVLSRSVPVRPGIVAVPTELTSDIGALLLGNSITLTPGTLTLDRTEAGSLLVHWIDVPESLGSETTGDEGATEPPTVAELVAGPFERRIRRIAE